MESKAYSQSRDDKYIKILKKDIRALLAKTSKPRVHKNISGVGVSLGFSHAAMGSSISVLKNIEAEMMCASINTNLVCYTQINDESKNEKRKNRFPCFKTYVVI